MTEEQKKQWGGARQGAGRPKGEPRKQYNWYLTEAEHQYLRNCLEQFREKSDKK